MPDVEGVDTLALARRMYTFPSNRLGALARSLGIEGDATLHRARADVHLTCRILGRMVRELEDRDLGTLGGLLSMQRSKRKRKPPATGGNG